MRHDTCKKFLEADGDHRDVTSLRFPREGLFPFLLILAGSGTKEGCFFWAYVIVKVMLKGAVRGGRVPFLINLFNLLRYGLLAYVVFQSAR